MTKRGTGKSVVMDLKWFLKAQRQDYAAALSEIQAGHKRSHWMWYVFPQIQGLGFSETARYYAIKDAEEARAYVAHPVLGARLREISRVLLSLDSRDATEIMGRPDDVKLRSSMTLFAAVSDDPVFQRILDEFFAGKADEKTLRILEELDFEPIDPDSDG